MNPEEMTARLVAIVESSDDAIISKSLDGTIQSWNRAAERIFGYTAAEAIGQKVMLIIPVERRSEEIQILARIRSGQKVDHFETIRQAKDGRLLNISLTVSPIKDATGRIIGASKVARDVTERVLLEQERRQRAKQLEAEIAVRRSIEAELNEKVTALAEADQRKNEFLAMLGHELRNPLFAVANAVTTAYFDEGHRPRALEIARRQTAQLTRLVDDLLDVARIVQRRIALRREVVSVAKLIDRALEETRAAADTFKLRVSIPPECRHLKVDGDPARLQQALGNLIHNAIKFSRPGGSIEVELSRRGAEAVVRVRDWGIGIAPQMLPRVFDLFEQAEVSVSRERGGLGIGLTLVKQLVLMHGGTVQARSEGLGKGSEFEIGLPIVNSDETLRSLASRTNRIMRRVLIVEDNPDVADSLAMLLDHMGHRAKIVGDGFAALEAVGAETFDTVLVDIGLPGIDGYEVARRMRMLPNFKVRKLIALTGYGQDDARTRALAAGFDQHMVKPLDVEELENILNEAAPAHAEI